MQVWRKAIPMDSIRGLTDVAWRIDRKTLLELYTIWFESGNMEIIKELDEGLYDLLADVMQEEL
jgi:heterodisulfide reductase subunit C